jgi:putative ABC transport system permease protein
MRFIRWFHTLPLRLRSLFRRRQVEQELDEELRYHLDRQIEENIKDGMSPTEARFAAHRALGRVEQHKDDCRDARRVNLIEDMMQDLRYGLRTLGHNPGFTFIAVLTLTLGIGANTAMFSIVHGVLLSPLPYAHEDRLVNMVQAYPQRGLATWGLSQANVAMYRDRSNSFEKFAAYNGAGFNLAGGAEPERLQGATVTADFFDVLGVQPGWGRVFRQEEDAPGKNQVCILSYSLWQRRFGGDPQILGQSLRLNEVPMEVVGIMPQGFAFPTREVEIWVPVGLNPQRMFGYFFSGLGRLKPGVTVAQAQVETTDVFWNAARENPGMAGAATAPPDGADMKTIVSLRRDWMVRRSKTPLLLLLGAVGLVLLIACANVANLLLARAASRTRELALRLALGASAGRVIRQLMAESMLLAVIGGVAGAGVAWLAVRTVRSLPALQEVPRIADVSVNGTVLAFTAGVAVVTGLLFGLAPALRAYRLGLQAGMREGGRGSASRSSTRLNGALVAAQFALCLVLLIGAGLLLKSFQRLMAVNPGFQPEHALSMRLALPRTKYTNGGMSVQFYDQLLERVRSLPVIRGAAITSLLPFTDGGTSDGIVVEGHAQSSGGLEPQAQDRVVSPDYFKTMGIPLLRGRDFTPDDRNGTALVAIVDETLAQTYWPDGDAIGKRLRYAWADQWMTIVGVAGGVKNVSLSETIEPHFYYPHAQDGTQQMYLVVRTVDDSGAVAGAIRDQVRGLDADLPVWGVQKLTDGVDETLSNQRLTNTLLGGFALLAVLLAAVGIYGVMSLYVLNRTNEFGIRLALGAQPGILLRSVLRQGLILTLAGVATGTGVAILLARTITSMLFEVSATDPIVFISVPLVLIGVTLIACHVPARRAMKVDPLVALRYE